MSSAGVTPLSKWARANVRIRNEYVTGFIGEYLGTFVLCMFAFGAGVTGATGNAVGSALGGSLGLMIAVTVFGGLSGAHVNPAVSFGLCITGHMSWLKLPVYWLAQFLGAYCGSGLGYGIWKHKLRNGNLTEVCGLFSGIPDLPTGACLLDQTITTAALFIVILSAIDQRNMKVPNHFFGLLFGLTVAAIGFTFGGNAGGSVNPARDLGPRLMAVTIGCDSSFVLKSGTEHFWLGTLFGPLIGAALAGFVYVFFVGSHLKDTDEDLKESDPNGDWRSTLYLPKAGQPSMPQNNNNAHAPVNVSSIPYGGTNPGYMRSSEDPRRQY